MLKVRSLDHLKRVATFAQAKGLTRFLVSRLWYLHTYAERTSETPDTAPELTSWDDFPNAAWLAHASGKRCTVTLGYDSAPASFYFDMSIGMNGGLIYHGDQSGWSADGSYQDPFAVQLCKPSDNNPWSVHT